MGKWAAFKNKATGAMKWVGDKGAKAKDAALSGISKLPIGKKAKKAVEPKSRWQKTTDFVKNNRLAVGIGAVATTLAAIGAGIGIYRCAKSGADGSQDSDHNQDDTPGPEEGHKAESTTVQANGNPNAKKGGFSKLEIGAIVTGCVCLL